MKLRAAAAVLAVAGLGTSVAIAKGPPPGDARDASGTPVRICHRSGPARSSFRPIAVTRSSLERHMRHGDLMAAGGGCPTSRFAAP